MTWPTCRHEAVSPDWAGACVSVREGATQRLLDVASISEDEWPGKWTRLRDWLIWRMVYAGNGKCPLLLAMCMLQQRVTVEGYTVG